MKISPLLFLASLLVPCQLFAQVYTWVDENGVTNYGSQPVGNSYQQVEVEPAYKPVDKKFQKLLDNTAKTLLVDHGDSEKVNCLKAVANSQSGLRTMLDVGRKNYRDGYIKKAQYQKFRKGLLHIKSELTLGDCKSATGDDLGFYRCMTNDRNHFATCADKYHSK